MPPGSSPSFILTLGWSCKNIHPVMSFSLLNTSIFPREKPNFLKRHCKFSQCWAHLHSYPRLLTLQAPIAKPRHISLNTSCPWPLGSGSWLSLSLEYSYLHFLPVKIKLTFKAQLEFHFPTTIHFNLIKSLCLLLHLFELLHSPWYQPCSDGEDDKDENVMQMELLFHMDYLVLC